MNLFYLVSVKHTKQCDKYVTLWRPSNAGYCNRLHSAGMYNRSEIEAKPNYYNNGEMTIAVDVHACERIAVPVEPGWFDDDHGIAIENTAENWATINANRIHTPNQAA